MQFARLFAVAAATFATANAAVAFTNSVFNNVTAGQSFTLTWSGATGPVEIILKNGPSTALVTVSVVTSGQSGTSFTYSVPANLPVDTYAFSISDGTTTNYSPQFQPLSATASPTSSGASSTSGSSSVSSSISSRSSSLSSSLVSSITANSTSSTASATSSSNSTTSGASSTGSATKTGSSTASKTSGTTTGSSTATGSTVPNTNAASEFASPLALVFLTVAAIISLN